MYSTLVILDNSLYHEYVYTLLLHKLCQYNFDQSEAYNILISLYHEYLIQVPAA